MKKFNLIFMPFFLALFFCVGFASCSSDDDDDLSETSNEDAVTAITGNWKGKIVNGNSGSSMTANFYSDGTVKIWWTENPLLATYYFSGTYTISKNKIRFKGMACTDGSSLSSGWDVEETTSYSLKNNILKFEFQLKQEWQLTAQ